jgi:hypothetical protein
MNTTWNFILAAAVTLASAAGIVSGEAAKGELRIAEAATSAGAHPGVLAWLTDGKDAMVAAKQGANDL